MSIDYIVVAMDDTVTQDIVLNAFSPYYTQEDEEEYLLNYGDEIYEDMDIHNDCRLSLHFRDDNKGVIDSVIVIRPCYHLDLEKAIFSLIHEHPMFFAAPDYPIMTANKRCLDLLKVKYSDTYEDTILISSFDEFSDILDQ